MLLGFTGNRFLLEEQARTTLLERGLRLRDLPRLSGEEVTAAALAPLLAPSLFGDGAVVLDLEGVKPSKDLLALVGAAPVTLAVLDPAAPASRVKLYQEQGQHFASAAPQKPSEVAGWTVKRARERGLKLEQGAALYLAEVFGPDLASIAGELNKLALLGGPPDREGVARVVGLEAPGDSFAMLDAATAGRPGEALSQLTRLLARGEDPYRLLGAVVWQYGLVARCVALRQEGIVGEQAAAARLGVKPYPAKKALEVAGRLSEAKIAAHLRRVAEADLAMKSGRSPALSLERLLVALSL